MSSQPQRPSVTADEELAAAIGADRAQMLRLLRTDLRPAFEALFQVDAAMGDVIARATQPALGAVKLAWWRERLEELDQGMVPAESRLRAVAEHLLPRGVTGTELAELEDGWATLLDAQVEPQRIADRGSTVFRLGGRLLGADDERLRDAGALAALVSVGRRGLPDLMDMARERERQLVRHRFERSLRPLTALARLAVRDLRSGPPFELEGAPPRVAAMLRHRWSGIVTRGD
jgi:15-cis-phytoene synthase